MMVFVPLTVICIDLDSEEDQNKNIEDVIPLPQISKIGSNGLVTIHWNTDIKQISEDDRRRLTETGLNVWVEQGS